MSQKITTHLWFDTQAKEAAAFYVDVFGQGSTITTSSQIHNTPSGDVDIVSFTLRDQDFMAISAGPLFKFNPSISFLVACKTNEEVDALWNKLIVGGKALMELDTYPFSGRYGWLQDQYGLSWQIMQMGDRPITQAITPTLMFVGDVCGRAEEAINFYTTVFHDTEVGNIMRHGANAAPEQAEMIAHAGFTLEGQEFAATDGVGEHHFNFNEAISLIVHCDTQAEIDYYWEKLSAVPESEQCGWLKDQYGVSWQIVPTAMDTMMASQDQTAIDRVTKAFLQMKKFDLAALERAYLGKYNK